MKLVEILARELDKWPEGAAYVGQACDGALHMHGHGQSTCFGWTKESYSTADDWLNAFVNRADWEAERARIKDAPEMPAAKYFEDGPLQWRDRVQEINRQMADLRAEKAGLIINLSDEGFTLIGEQPF